MRLYVAVLLGYSATAGGQEFEVAAVKPEPPLEGPAIAKARAQDSMYSMMPAGFLPVKGGRVSLEQRTFAQLVAVAYKLKPSDVTGPGWIAEQRYNIQAKLPEGADPKDANAMLKRLLEERFALKAHSETKTVSGYALLAAKDGPKLKPAEEHPEKLDPEEMSRRSRERAQARMEEMLKTGRARGYSSWSSNSATMAQIAENVGRMIKSPVTDETGLTGKYDVEVVLLPGESDDDTVEYRMAQALAKLGLKLESRKTTVTLLVVDSASKTPTEN
jgi:uncharacterized protein (TIGR03435 family)